LPEKTKALLAGEKTKFIPGELRDRVDIDLINSGFDGVKYAVIGISDYKNDYSGLNSGFFHSKFVGSSSECTKFTGEEKIIGENSTGEKAKISGDYLWNNRFSRCNAVESGVYCDGAQFMQKVSANLEEIQELLEEGISFNSNEIQSLLSFQVKLKHEGLSKDLVKDFKGWSLAGTEDMPPIKFIEMQELYSDLIDFRLLGSNLEIIDETSESNPAIELTEPGIYQIDLIIDFENSAEPLLIQGTEIKTESILINLRKISNPEKESVLYYLPFNSTMGLIDGSREGYGVIVSGEESSIKEFELLEIEDALINLRIEVIHDFGLLNYQENRGSLIQIEKESTNNYIVIQQLPYATPVLMIVSDDKYDAFYSLEKGTTNPAEGLQNIGIWTGIGSTMTKPATGICTGFEENPLPRGFKDATASSWQIDGFETNIASGNEEKAYGLSFKRTNSTGFPTGTETALYSVFYTTTHQVYGSEKVYLKNASTGNAVFIDPKTKHPLNNIPLNFKQESIYSIQDLINLVDEKQSACIALEKNSMDLFWNEDKLAFNSFQEFISNTPSMNYCSPNQTQEYGYNEWG